MLLMRYGSVDILGVRLEDRDGAAITGATVTYTILDKLGQEVLSGSLAEVGVDDPGAYTAPWKSGFYLRFTAGESFEFVCQDNNQAPEMIVGDGTFNIRPPVYIP